MISQQDIFTSIVTQTLKQNEHSLRPSGRGCAYRGKRGLKCAVGCVLPDSAYYIEMDTSRLNGVLDIIAELCRRFGSNAEIVKEMTRDLDLLLACQRVHDLVMNPDDWEAEFAHIAHDFNLKMPKIIK